MNDKILIFLILVSGVVVFMSSCSKKEERKPNIVLIMSDDMGYSDIGCYGGEVNTPALDSLAANGVRFSQFYNTARCCPTRASLMTGLYPHQTGIGHMTNSPNRPDGHNYGFESYEGSLNNECVTLAQVLKGAGYNTFMTGKWHLGLDFEDWPLQRGFDKFYGIVPGASNFFKPEPPRGITYMNEPVEVTDPDFYTTDAFTEYAMKFIDDWEDDGKNNPFFLYLAYTAPHWPLHAPDEEIAKYRGKYLEGWVQLREDRYKKMRDLGLIDSNWLLTKPDASEWNSLTDEKKDEMDFRRAIYSGMIDRMDQNIGKLVENLKAKGELDNTIIIFLNDNGACAEGGMLGGGPKKQLGTKQGYFLSYGKAWANASNTPYREYKHWVHEGGISTPFIVHWPKGIPSQNNGMLIKEYGFLPDLMASFVDVAEAEYPTEFNGNSIPLMPGKSLIPILKGDIQPVHDEPIFWEHEGNKAVRLGKYKLVSKWNKKNEFNWELYDMNRDRTETNDLSKRMPEKTSEMIALWENWAKENQVKSWTEINKVRRDKRNNEKK